MNTLYQIVSGLALVESSFATMTIESEMYDIKKVNEAYQSLANFFGIEVKALRGDYFYPPEFWQRPVDSILGCLMPTLNESSLRRVIAKEEALNSCTVGASRKLLLTTEQFLTDGICAKIEEFMKAKSLVFEADKYRQSLKMGRESANPRSAVKVLTPLITFFYPFFSRYWELSIKK